MHTQTQTKLLLYRIGVLIGLTTLCACTTVHENASFITEKPLQSSPEHSIEAAEQASFSAALSPLEDLGLRQRKIPELLARLAQNPYYPPPRPLKCDDIRREMAQLDALLGDDADSPKLALTGGEKIAMVGADMAQDAVVNFIKGQVNIIPFKSIVRRMTGANKHEKLVAQAIQGGSLRRAYLRGLSVGQFGDRCLAGPVVVTAEKQNDPTPPAPVTLSDRLEIVAKTW